jgi:ABC-2 type transport system permease protein
MLRAFRSEWLKLRRPGMALAAGVIVGLGALSTAITITAAQATPVRRPGPGSGRPTLHELAAADGLARALERGATLLGVVALVIFAVAVAAEYSQGTLRNLLVRQPHRLRLLAGKLLATASLVAIAVVVSLGTAAAVGFALGAGRGIETSAWTSATGLQALATGGGDLLLATLGWGLLGAALGLILRSPALAIGVGMAYALPLETILTAAWSTGARWLPGQLLLALATGGSADVTSARGGDAAGRLPHRRARRGGHAVRPPRRHLITTWYAIEVGVCSPDGSG